MIFLKILKPFFFTSLFLVVLISQAMACDVPVYRYALERWPAALFELSILHQGSLSEEQKKIVDWLDRNSSDLRPESNYQIRIEDIESPLNSSARETWESLGKPNLPCLVLDFPEEFRILKPAWSGPLTISNANRVVDSPLRQEIAKKLLEEDSAVWIFLESGNTERDEAAKNLLNAQLYKLEKTLELPEAVTGNFMKEFGVTTKENESPLQIQFSTLNLSRNDPAEEVFTQMLLSSEPDLIEYATQPMAFPVYGRGRALYALVGLGITEDNIEETCRFLTGPCACEVKAENPGTDLLMVVDWDSGLDFSAVSAIQDQPLVSLAAMAEAATPSVRNASSKIALVETHDPIEKHESRSLLSNILILVGLLLVIDIILIFIIYQRRLKRNQ